MVLWKPCGEEDPWRNAAKRECSCDPIRLIDDAGDVNLRPSSVAVQIRDCYAAMCIPRRDSRKHVV